MKAEMRRDTLGKRYYEVCTNEKCGYEIELSKLGPKKRK